MDLPLRTRPDQDERSRFPHIKFESVSLNGTQQMLCPDLEPISPNACQLDPSIREHERKAAHWQRRFLAAMVDPIATTDEVFVKWRQTLDRKITLPVARGYTNHDINFRLALLFQIALNCHVGGPRYYQRSPSAQDDECDPWFTLERCLLEIESILRENKRIVMDVIEGTEVVAFVQAPIRRYSMSVKDGEDEERRSQVGTAGRA